MHVGSPAGRQAVRKVPGGTGEEERMAAKMRAHLSYANVVSSLALFLVLAGGTALALSANSVTSRHIRNGQVKSVDLQNGGVKGVDIRESTLGRTPEAEEASLATELKFVGQAIWNSGADPEGFGAIAAHTCVDAPPVEAEARPGDRVLGTVNGGNAPNPLPPGLTATFTIENGNVLLRLCNATDVAVPAFDLTWDFVVLRERLSPD
jgi:hypothetical protein